MPARICELCGNRGELRDSHVWPKFAYKRYVAEQAHGGRFTDLVKETHHNKQVTEYLLCADCEERLSRAERSTAQFLTQAGQRPTTSHQYGPPFHDFVVSISWRTTLYYIRSTVHGADTLREPLRYWKQCLLGKRRQLGPYSQHGFLSFGQSLPGKDAEWHRSLGGQVFVHEGLVLSRIGPLLLVGMLKRSQLSLAEIRIWEKSRIWPVGGAIHLVTKSQPQDALTPAFAKLLNRLEQELIDAAARM